MLRAHVEGRPDPQPFAIVAVAVQEFEAWLIADDGAIRSTLQVANVRSVDPEGLAPTEAKSRLYELLAEVPVEPRKKAIPELATKLDLIAVAMRCSAFERFRSELHAFAKLRAASDLGR
jgi:hypothetical protein